MKTVVMNLGQSFAGILADVRKHFGPEDEVIVLALLRDAEPFRDEPSLIERSGVKDAATRIVFVDEAEFDPRALGQDLTGKDVTVIMNGGMSRHGWTSVRVFDQLAHGRLINLQRDFVDVLEQK